MKRALIDSNNNRVVQIADEDFPVHGALYWVDCPDDCGTYYIYDPENLTFEDPHAHSKDEFGNPVEPFSMQRMRAYPGIGDQLDLLFKEIRDSGSISASGAWFQSIQAVKNAIPKPVDPDAPVQHLNSDGSLVTFYENITPSGGSGTGARLKFRKTSDGLQVAATTAGSNYVTGDTISVSGSSVDESGTIEIEVLAVGDSGGIVMLGIR
jgi:hypothetical protein